MKTETITLPAYWASALINGDYSGLTCNEETQVDKFIADYPFYGACIGCSENAEFAFYGDTFASGKLCECLDYTFPVIYEKHGHLIYPCSKKTSMLPWQKLGLQYTATGYGKKIPTSKMILLCGKWRRIYCDIFSNVGTCYIIFKGERLCVN